MSGFTNVTGFAPPTSAAGFMGLLQKAYWRGVPFSVTGAVTRKGRKVAIHEYPFRDGGWAEDMGRAQRIYSFTGYLIGDIAPAMQLLLDGAAEAAGPGLLIHPTLGAQMVSLLSCSTSVRKDAMRVIEVAFEFIEQGSQIFPVTLIATAIQVASAADLCLPSFGADLGSAAGTAAMAGPLPIGEGVTVVDSFGASCAIRAADPAGLIAMATGLPPPNTDLTYGRYAIGNATVSLPQGTTVASLVAQITTQRAAVAAAASVASESAETFSAASAPAVVNNLAALVETMRVTMTDPADQCRVLLDLATFTFTDSASGTTGLPGDMATLRDAMAATCRRTALVSLARAVSTYQPISYQDAINIRALVGEALNVEITATADAGLDETYASLKNLRAAVVLDLTTRGATLPQVITVSFGASLPALTVAQILYRDASRSDQITSEANPPHPAFCPVSMQVLAS